MHRSYPGLYRGTCVDTSDPESRGRIRVKVPQVFGNSSSNWAWPCLPTNWRTGVVKAHGDHTFTDHNDGTGSSGNVAQDLSHTHNHEVLSLVPAVGTTVWIMFEAGNPDHPVWLGTI